MSEINEANVCGCCCFRMSFYVCHPFSDQLLLVAVVMVINGQSAVHRSSIDWKMMQMSHLK